MQKMLTGVRPQPPPASATAWDCPQCGHHNRRENNICPMCAQARPAAAGKK
jgi:rubrerythrin